MSVTHPDAGLVSAPRRSFVQDHPQFTPFLAAVAIVVVSIVVSLAFTGLPT